MLHGPVLEVGQYTLTQVAAAPIDLPDIGGAGYWAC